MNYFTPLTVLAATVASFATGALWYGPVFGRYWMKLMGFTPESMKSMKMTPAKAMSIGFVSQAAFACVLAIAADVVLGYGDTLVSSLLFAVIIWLGFYVPTTLGAYLWEGKPFRLVAFNAAYQLVVLLVALGTIMLLAKPPTFIPYDMGPL